MPLEFPVGALPDDYAALRAAVDRLARGARDGYQVVSVQRQTRAFGSQSLPTRVRVESAEGLLRLAGKQAEFAALAGDVALIRMSLPQLEGWLRANPQHVIASHGDWPALLRVCAYFLANPRPGCYIRELPIEVHTKFIETHTGILRKLLDALLPADALDPAAQGFERRYGLRVKEPLVRLRFLDPALQGRSGLPLAELAAPPSQLAALPLGGATCLIVENEMTFLTLPPLAGALALWGGGFAVDALGGLPWLGACRVWYWGDLDAQGFQILARLRSLIPHAHSLMMDERTLSTFEPFVGTGTPCTAQSLPGLSDDEQAMFLHLARSQLRLEQEQISQPYVVSCLQRWVG